MLSIRKTASRTTHPHQRLGDWLPTQLPFRAGRREHRSLRGYLIGLMRKFAFFVQYGAIPALATVIGMILLPAPETATRAAEESTSQWVQWLDDQKPSVALGFFVITIWLMHTWRHHLPWAGWLLGKPRAKPVVIEELENISTLASRLRRVLSRSKVDADSRSRLNATLQTLHEAEALSDISTLRTTRMAAQRFLKDNFGYGTLADRLLSLALPAVAVLAALGIRTYAFQVFRVPTSSMMLTLQPGDRIGVSKLAYGMMAGVASVPRRGDLIVFSHNFPNGPLTLVKRVVAMPGDRITLRDGHPVINDQAVPFCYAGILTFLDERWQHFRARVFVEALGDTLHLAIHTPYYRSFDHEYRVKPGEVFVLGDNRNNSTDSRAWNAGIGEGVALRDILGRADWLLSSGKGLPAPTELLFPSLRDIPFIRDTIGAAGEAAEIRSGIEKCLREAPHWNTSSETALEGQNGAASWIDRKTSEENG